MNVAETCICGVGYWVFGVHAEEWYSWVNDRFIFKFLRIPHIDFQSGWASLQPH